MKQDISVEAFKHGLRGYHYWTKKKNLLEEEIQLLYDKLGASPRSPKLDGVSIHSPRNIDAEYAIRDKIDVLEQKLKHCDGELRYYDETLAKMETSLKMAIIAIYANKESMQKQADKMFISKSTLREHINKEIKKVLADWLVLLILKKGAHHPPLFLNGKHN